MNRKTKIYIGGVLLIVLAVIAFWILGGPRLLERAAIFGASEDDPEDNAIERLAQCLNEKGVVVYGAYWCPHCKNQKKLFGGAWDDVTYIECAYPGNPGIQASECKQAAISGYPTWVFPDGLRLEGEQRLASLAAQAGCAYEEKQADR